LHWIDSETQALLYALVESLPTARLLLLTVYRPEYAHRWGSKTYYTQLRIDPLTGKNAEELLRTLLGTHASVQPLVAVLIERTEGNPLYLEESIRTLAETENYKAAGAPIDLAQRSPAFGYRPRSKPYSPRVSIGWRRRTSGSCRRHP
jgi:predicted ATPase